LDLLFDLTRLWDENETHREKTAHAAASEDRRGANKELKADLTPLLQRGLRNFIAIAATDPRTS